MKRGWIPIMGVCLVLSFSACKQLLPYQDTSLTAEQRAEDLLPRLTLEEKSINHAKCVTCYPSTGN